MRLLLLRSSMLMIAAGLLVATSGTGALSNENCRRLEDLARQYAGVQLTSAQQRLKRRLTAWYNDNCKRTRNVHARRIRATVN
jgi:ABC-type transport system involved in cytochrome c biogenesis ATPase subunit